MKEILSSQYEAISGGWQDADGSGRKSSTNGGSSSSGGNNGNNSLQSFISQNSPYGSGSGAYGYWGGGGVSSGNMSGVPAHSNVGRCGKR